MRNSYTVYKHTAPSGKVYIGITQQELSKRWKNGLGYEDNPYFFAAIRKYGWDCILHEVLFEGLSKEAAEEIEVRLIAEYDSANREKGYNIARGGNATAPTEETKRKISESTKAFWSIEENRRRRAESMRGVKRSEDARKKISVSQKKRFTRAEERRKISERQIGRPRSEEAKRKTSESLRAFYSNPENKAAVIKAQEGASRKAHAKKVLCVETGEIFEAVVDAEKKCGADHRNITAVCRGKRKRAGGFRWKYA